MHSYRIVNVRSVDGVVCGQGAEKLGNGWLRSKRNFGGIKLNGDWRQQCNDQLMQLLG